MVRRQRDKKKKPKLQDKEKLVAKLKICKLMKDKLLLQVLEKAKLLPEVKTVKVEVQVGDVG